MLEVPGVAAQEPETPSAPVPKECRTAEVCAENRMFILSEKIRELPGVCGATMTPAPQPSEYERVKIFSLVKDEDGTISRVPMCLCELCRVNHFLCPRYASHSSAVGEAVLDFINAKWIKQYCDLEIKSNTERWEHHSRQKNDPYTNGSQSGYVHALQDLKRLIERLEKLELRQQQKGEPVKVCPECGNDYTGTGYIKGDKTVCSGCNYRTGK